MMAPRRFQHNQSRSEKRGQDELDHAAVVDPDPASHRSADNVHQMCRFEWADETSPTLVLRWICTRERGHQGQHIAGTGEWAPTPATHPQTPRHDRHQHRSPPRPERQKLTQRPRTNLLTQLAERTPPSLSSSTPTPGLTPSPHRHKYRTPSAT